MQRRNFGLSRSLLAFSCLIWSVLALLGTSFAGRIVAWGDNSAGQTDVPPDLTNVVGIAAGNWHGLALTANGTVTAWGAQNGYDHGQGRVPDGLTNVAAIACGYWHNVALLSNDTVVAWGGNQFGQLNVPTPLTDVIAISCGSAHTLALKSNGKVVAWGHNYDGQSFAPPNNRGFVGIVGSSIASLGLRADGTVTAWGTISPPTDLTNVLEIASGGSHYMALRQNGTITVWGSNSEGQTNVPASVTNVAILASKVAHTLALRRDGTVVGWGWNDAGQSDVPPLSNVVAVATGARHSLALMKDTLAPAIIRKPIFVPLVENQKSTLSVAAMGTTSLQWFHNDVPIAGASNSFLIIPTLKGTNAGTYSVEVSDGTNSVTYSGRQIVLMPQMINGPNLNPDATVEVSFSNYDGTPHQRDDAIYFDLQGANTWPGSENTRVWRRLSSTFQFTNGYFYVSEALDTLTNQFFRVQTRLP